MYVSQVDVLHQSFNPLPENLCRSTVIVSYVCYACMHVGMIMYAQICLALKCRAYVCIWASTHAHTASAHTAHELSIVEYCGYKMKSKHMHN